MMLSNSRLVIEGKKSRIVLEKKQHFPGSGSKPKRGSGDTTKKEKPHARDAPYEGASDERRALH
jgi:hypothetical protein